MKRRQDIAKCGKVAFPRFRAILDFHKIVLKEDEYKLLCKRYGNVFHFKTPKIGLVLMG